MLAAFAKAARVLEGPVEGADETKANGYLEGYAYVIEGLLELGQTTFESRCFVAAQELAETILGHFRADGVRLRHEPQLPSNAPGIAGFYDTSDDHEALITGKCQAIGIADSLRQVTPWPSAPCSN